MSEHTHHHHHHHHKEDDASRFKRKSLLSLHRRKVIKKYAFIALCIIAVLMAIATVVVYRLT
ncbi:MAG: hypothetical protein K5896_09730 [Prevotella sp.]|jgi:hypothetical protein|nr:hypothetical protein [Prevotella sp.]